MDEPSIEQMGHLVSFECGHNGKPKATEIALLTVHMDYAGFLTQRRALLCSNRKFREVSPNK
jgi:hypothetical protein